MPFYRILPGYSFRDDQGLVRAAGDVIEVPLDIALGRPESLEFVGMTAPAADADAEMQAAAQRAADQQRLEEAAADGGVIDGA